jgi:hypothetical protein
MFYKLLQSMFRALQLVDRASCYFCLQEWAAGIKDLCYVLVFVPNHKKALLLRFDCVRCVRDTAGLCKLLPSLLHELLVVMLRAYPLSVSCEVCFANKRCTLWCHAEPERTRACGSGRCPEPTTTPCCSTIPTVQRRRRACRTSRTRSSCCPCWGTTCWITVPPEIALSQYAAGNKPRAWSFCARAFLSK